MANDVANVKIEPCNLFWGNPETTRIALTADVSGSHNNDYFSITSTAGVLYHVWYNINGAGVDPAPSGSTAIPVTGATNATAATLASATATAVNAHASFNAKIDPDDSTKIIIQNVGIGTATNVADGAGGNATGFTITQLRDGSSFEIGLIDGDVEISASEDLFEVIAQQTGTTVVDKIRTGNTVENIAVAMKESAAAKLKTILEAGGASVTPSGGTEVTGWGESKRFLNVSNDCRQLIFHPVRNAVGTLTNDWCFWRAYPNLAGFNFSGETDQIINVEFQIIPDPIILVAQNQFVYGDHTQLLLR